MLGDRGGVVVRGGVEEAGEPEASLFGWGGVVVRGGVIVRGGGGGVVVRGGGA